MQTDQRSPKLLPQPGPASELANQTRSYFFLAAHEASLRASRGEGKLSLPFPGRGACGSVMTLASHTATVPLRKESPGAPLQGSATSSAPEARPGPGV